MDDPIDGKLEVVPASALEMITRGEIDIQISTAHKFPRSMTVFKRRGIEMACIDQETAESCIYVRPVGKKAGKMEYAEGLSVRMAEIVGASYGNLRVGSMIVEQTDRYVVCRGFAHDLETNFASSSEVKEPTVKSDGSPFSEGMRAVVAKAALSKARRDATFQVVPKALCRPIEKAARQLIAGDAKSLSERKAAAGQYVSRLKIAPERIWGALGIKGEDDLTAELLLTLTGLRSAIKDGDTTIDEAFPPVVADGKIGAAEERPKSPLASAKKEKPAPPADPAPAAHPSAETAPATEAPKLSRGHEELIKLLFENRISEAKFMAELARQGMVLEGAVFDSISDSLASQCVDAWDELLPHLKGK